jgi:hypothetical protein
MNKDSESELRMALRHVRQGQDCIERQHKVIANLRDRGLPTDQAEGVLCWLEEWQRQFEEHYNRVLSDAQVELERRRSLADSGTEAGFASSRSLS